MVSKCLDDDPRAKGGRFDQRPVDVGRPWLPGLRRPSARSDLHPPARCGCRSTSPAPAARVRPGLLAAAFCSTIRGRTMPLLRGLVVVRRRHGIFRRTKQRCRPRRSAQPRSHTDRGRCRHPPRRTCRARRRARSPFSTMWQVEVPMIATMRPGSDDTCGRHGHVRIHVGHGHGDAGRRPVQPAASAVSSPALSPSGDQGRVTFLSPRRRRIRGASAAK